MEDIEWLSWPYRNPRTTGEDMQGQYTWGECCGSVGLREVGTTREWIECQFSPGRRWRMEGCES